jgi:hypothetical protein
MTPWQQFQQAVWRRIIYPIFPFFQKRLLFLHEQKRQRFHIGWLAQGKTFEQFKAHLQEQGFGNHFIAWTDPGQVLSWRKLESFEQQYHIRVFEDGEVRGHFEYTPEAYPVKHFKEIGEEARTEKFVKLLGDFVTARKKISHLSVDESMSMPHPQYTYDDSLKIKSV